VTTSGLSFAGDDGALLGHVGRLLGVELGNDDDLACLVASGISVRAFNEFANRLPLPKRLVRSVLHRQRRGTGLRLSPIETEAVLRIARAYARAQGALADDARALEWFTKPAPYLAGYDPISPLELSMTETGARLVEARLRAHQTASTRSEANDALAASARVMPKTSSTRARDAIDYGPSARL
jgi:putative toxin-antitoxin system antitoxin component (TIGR02293 family)